MTGFWTPSPPRFLFFVDYDLSDRDQDCDSGDDSTENDDLNQLNHIGED